MIKRMLTLAMLVCLFSTAMASDIHDDEEKKMPPPRPQNIDIIKKAMINREIKKKTRGVFNKAYSAPFFEKLPYTQTEAYLKADLGDKYQENDLLNNIETFIKSYTIGGRPFPAADIISPQAMVDIIKNEKEYGGYNCFYNALRNEWGFEYDVLDRLRQILSIVPDADGRRTYGRLFDSLFKKYPTIQEAIRRLGLNDTHPEYQMRIASTNIFLFGNIQNKGESTLAYLDNAHAHDEIPRRPQCEILEWAFKELGFDRVEERISRYANLFQSTEALWRRHVLQQIFVANASVHDLTYPSVGYGTPAHIMSRKEMGDSLEPMLPIMIGLRRDPVQFFAEHKSHMMQPKLDIYSVQARLLWDPQAIAEQKMIIIPWSFWSGSQKTESDLRKELQEAMQKIDQLIIQDLADLLELKGSASLKEAGIDSRLHKLKELVTPPQAVKN